MVLVYTLLLLGGLIFFHEWGHYLLARANGIHVETFSIGFGPKLFGWKGKAKDGMPPTEYVVAALPLGGYVKMLGYDAGEEIPAHLKEVAFSSKKVWQRFTVVAAGPAFNLILPFIIIFFAGLTKSHDLPPSLGTVTYDGPAWNAGLRPGDTIVGLGDQKIEYWWQVAEFIEDRPGESFAIRWKRGDQEMSAEITPQAFERVVNAKLGITELRGRTGISPVYALPIIHVAPGSPAETAGLKSWDRVIAIDGQPSGRMDGLERVLEESKGRNLSLTVLTFDEKKTAGTTLGVGTTRTVTLPAATEGQEALRGISSAEMIISRVTPGTPAERVGLKPGDKIVNLDGQLVNSWTFFESTIKKSADPDKTFTLEWIRNGQRMRTDAYQLAEVAAPHRLKQDNTRLTMGLQTAMQYASPKLIDHDERLAYALNESWSMTTFQMWLTFKAIGGLITGELSTKELGGPIMIGQMAAETGERGWAWFFQLMAFLSVNLGLINLLPVPVLDGGQIMFLAIETARRRPVSLRTRQIATYVGLAFIALLMVLVFKNDIERLLVG